MPSKDHSPVCRIFYSSFVICMPTRVLDLNSVFSTVGHGCLSIGTNFMTFTNQSMDHLINIETAFAGRFCQADTVVGIFQFSPRRAYDSFFDNFVFSDDD